MTHMPSPALSDARLPQVRAPPRVYPISKLLSIRCAFCSVCAHNAAVTKVGLVPATSTTLAHLASTVAGPSDCLHGSDPSLTSIVSLVAHPLQCSHRCDGPFGPLEGPGQLHEDGRHPHGSSCCTGRLLCCLPRPSPPALPARRQGYLLSLGIFIVLGIRYHDGRSSHTWHSGQISRPTVLLHFIPSVARAHCCRS